MDSLNYIRKFLFCLNLEFRDFCFFTEGLIFRFQAACSEFWGRQSGCNLQGRMKLYD